MKTELASNNLKKLLELQDILAPMLDLVAASQFGIKSPAETGTTFVENAIIKARHAAHITGLAALADDSGLEVDTLNGAPGIHSSRYAGDAASDEENNIKLLSKLEGIESRHRTARFRCVIVMLRHEFDPMPLIASGTWEGEILTKPRGDNGFGYDPLFLIPYLNRSSAQLSAIEKNQISHRAKAISRFKHLLES